MKRRLGWELKTYITFFFKYITVNRSFLEFLIFGKTRDREAVYRKATNMIDGWIVGDIEEMLKDTIEISLVWGTKNKGILESSST